MTPTIIPSSSAMISAPTTSRAVTQNALVTSSRTSTVPLPGVTVVFQSPTTNPSAQSTYRSTTGLS